MRTTILITGANGFLAGAVANAIPRDWRLVGLVRESSIPSVANRRYDGYFESVDALFDAESQVAVVLHLAARIPRSMNHPDPHLALVNVSLPAQLLARYPWARHVMASSTSVYGRPTMLPISIDTPAAPCTPYGWSKLSAECLVRTASDYAILRLSSIIGCGMRSGSFIPTMVAAARDGRMRLLGDGSRTQDYIDVRDAAAMCVHAALATKDNFVALAVSGRAPTNLQVAEELARLTGAGIEFSGEDASPSFAYTLDRSPALQSSRISLHDTLIEMLSQ
ncbi:NAD-dependent epimerase/dehydratase family protein [Luteimonas cucumeris]|nr:NAD(P)-dependent oxidoreductase [Luteimonas cucumeris]